MQGLKDWEYCYKAYGVKLEKWRNSRFFKLDQIHPDYEGHTTIARRLIKELSL
jgi:hypothetical protein